MYYRSCKCYTFLQGHPKASTICRRSSDEYVNFIFRSSCQFSTYLLDKKLSITVAGAMIYITLANVILFVGVARRLHSFVYDHPLGMSISLIGRVVCESKPVIQLSSYSKYDINFVGAIVYYRSRKCNRFPDSFIHSSSIIRRVCKLHL